MNLVQFRSQCIMSFCLAVVVAVHAQAQNEFKDDTVFVPDNNPVNVVVTGTPNTTHVGILPGENNPTTIANQDGDEVKQLSVDKGLGVQNRKADFTFRKGVLMTIKVGKQFYRLSPIQQHSSKKY